MNTTMHGRKIQLIRFPAAAPSYTGQDPVIRINDGSLRTLQLSATYNGDRDEFWVLHLESDGTESARYNVRHIETIVWLPVSESAP